MSRRDQLERIARLPPGARARLLEQLRVEAAAKARDEAIDPLPPGAEAPLSAAQQGLWILDRMAPGSAAYNMPLAVAAAGHLVPAALASAIAGVAERHRVLRTVFSQPEDSDQPRPRLLSVAEGAPRPALVDLSRLPVPLRETISARLTGFEGGHPFDLTRGPLLRCVVLRLEAHEHALLFTLHHIVGDGWSSGLLIDEVARLYAAALSAPARGADIAKPAELPELRIQYSDYAAWQRRRLAGATLAGDLAYWRQRLAGAPRGLELPRDRSVAPRDLSAGAQLPVHVPAYLLAPLERVARARETTLFVVLLASFLVLLERYTGDDDLVVGTPVAGRGRPELERLIGYFVNTVVLRCAMPAEGSTTFEGLVGALKEPVLAAFAHQDVPFERLVEELAPDRRVGGSPLFDTLFVLGNAPARQLELEELTLTPLPAGAGGAKFDLTLSLEAAASPGDGETPASEPEAMAGLRGFWEYSPELFDRSTLERLALHWRALLVSIASDPACRLDRLPMMTPAQRHQLIAEWNDALLPRRAYLLGRHDRLAPIGGVGTVVLTAGTAEEAGNADPPAASRWMPDPFAGGPLGTEPGGRLLRTGKRARYRPEGSLEPVAPWRRSEPTPTAAAARLAPRTETERAVAELWTTLLGTRELGVRDNFFELGGHSLLATRLLVRIRRAFGVELELAELFREPTVEALARAVDSARRGGQEETEPETPLRRLEREPGALVPLSFAQARMWILDRLTPEPAAYHIAAAVELAGRVEVAALASALARIEARHEPLRARFVEVDGEPGQRFAAPRAATELLPLVDLSGLELGLAADVTDRLTRSEARGPFHLATAPHWRARLLRLAPRRHRLSLTFHHGAADGWSVGLFTAELAALYADPAVPLPPLELRYGDYAAWQRRHLDEEWASTQLAWWRDHLAGAPALLELPTDRPRPALRRHRGARLPVTVAAPLTAAVTALAHRRGATPFMVLAAALGTLLARSSRQPEVVLGFPVAGRSRPEIEGLIGMFVNSLALRVPAGSAATFEALLDAVRANTLAALAHQELPFERLVEKLDPDRRAGATPIFQGLFALQTAPPPNLELSALTLAPLDVETGTAKLDLALELTPRDGRLEGHWEYDLEIFDPTTVRRLSARWVNLLGELVARPDAPLSRARELAPAERHQVEVEWNDTGSGVSGLAVHRHLLALADRHPDRPAVDADGRVLTYGALASSARALASRLRRAGVGPEILVALLLQRSPELMVAMTAVLEAGGAFLPIDPTAPDRRLDYLLADAGARLLLTDSEGAARASQRLSGAPPAWIVDSEAPGTAEPIGDLGTEPIDDSEVPASRLAYVIYTSGSTGKPKGVGVAHRGLTSLIGWFRHRYAIEPGERSALFTSPGFDALLVESWSSLSAGGCLVIGSDDVRGSADQLARWLLAREVDLAFIPAALVEPLILRPWSVVSRLRWLASGGDRQTARPPADLPFAVHNLYGPTEATVMVTAGRVAAAGVSSPSIGRPIAGVRCHVVADLSSSGPGAPRLAPIGVPGELWLSGAGLARGYLGRPALTAAAFTPDPFGERPGRRTYRTGDRVRWRADGALEFLGRVDHQIKLRGVRIEPGEIEAALVEHPRVASALVELRMATASDARLAAWVVTAASESGLPGIELPALTAGELAEHLRSDLPASMVPAAFTVLERFPMTAAGKIDRAALPAPHWGWHQAGEPQRLRAGIEETLAELWRGVLETDGAVSGPVGAHDDFFDLGGHSLLAARLVSRIRESFGVELPLRALFETPTLRELAARLESERSEAGGAIMAPPLRPLPAASPRPLSHAQERMWLLTQLAPASAAYHLPTALALDGELHPGALARALATVVERHEALRTLIETSPGGEPVARLAPPPRWRGQLPLVDLSALKPVARGRMAARLRNLEARQPYDLSRGPLLRSRLLRLGGEDHRLLLNLHHVAADGWSVAVLLREVKELYRGGLAPAASGSEPLAPLALQYADYAAWQRAWLGAGEDERQLAYWRRQLAELPASSELPADRPGDGSNGGRTRRRVGQLPFVLTPAETEAARAVARRHGATLFMAMTATLAALLSRYNGQRDLALGSPVANRSRAEIEGLIGFFVNTLVLRVDLRGAPGFATLLSRVRDTALDGFAHQELPFERLVEALAPERSLERSPFFQLFLTVQNAPLGELALPGLKLRPLPTVQPAAKFDLSITLIEGDGPEAALSAIEYDAGRFDRATVARFAGQLRRLLAAAARDPETPLARLPLLSEAERHQLLIEGSTGNPARVEKNQESVLGSLERQVALRPHAVALCGPEGTLSYGALGHLARRWADRLRAAGAGPERPVAVAVPRGQAAILALLAALEARAPYLPLDPAQPAARLRRILAEARPAVLVADVEAAAKVDPKAGGPTVLSPAWLSAEEPTSVAVSLSEPGGRSPASASLAAYVLYTSGSTGPPKGVVVAVGALAAHLGSVVEAYGLAAEDRVLCFASFAFDVSIEQVLAPLSAGARLELRGEELWEPSRLAAEAVARRVSLLNLPTAYWNGLVGDRGAMELLATGGLRVCLVGGESMSPEMAARWVAGPLAEVALANVYGPTETVITTTLDWVAVRRNHGGGTRTAPATNLENTAQAARPGRSVSLGRPLPGRSAFVVDRDGELASPGALGELWLGSAMPLGQRPSDARGPLETGLARGYLGDPRRTAELFVPHPFSALPGLSPGSRLYRSGDLARIGNDGGLEFMGRRDAQVKIRGFRVEPGAVEAALAALPGIRQAVVVPRSDAGGTLALVAYCVLDESLAGEPEEAVERMRGQLAAALPAYALPAALVPIAAFPLTERGKLDRAALPAPVWAAAAGRAASTATERQVATVWRQLLGLDSVGADDDFFALGGHSLLAMRAVARLRQETGREIELRQLFATPTVAGLAASLDAGRADELPPIVALPRGEGEPPLSFAQERLWFLHQMEPQSPVYNIPAALRLEGGLGVAALARTLGEVVARHAVLRTRFASLDGQPRARVEPPRTLVPLPVVDLTGLSRQGRGSGDSMTEVLARRASRRPFDLERDPPLRALLLRRASDHLLVLTVHHIASDGTSTALLVAEIEALYPAFLAGGPSPLPPLRVQYADFAAWQRTRLAGTELERQLGYWRAQLADLPPALDLPTDRPRPRQPSHSGGQTVVELPGPAGRRLAETCRQWGVTPFMGFLALYASLLGRWCGQRDLAIGSPVANRARVETEGLIGLFVNTVVLRADLRGRIGFEALLDQVRETAVAAYAHQDVPFELLVGELTADRDLDRSPLFQTLMTVETTASRPIRLPQLEIETLDLELGAAKFDLMLTWTPRPDGAWRGYLEYRRELFDATTLERLGRWLVATLTAALAEPDRPVLELPLLSAAERHQLALEFNDTAATPPAAAAEDLWRGFEARCERSPDAVALATPGGEQVSYVELRRRALRLARGLRAAGVAPGDRVAVCMERSWELVASLLASLAAGAAYVPLAPGQPLGRLGAILADAGPRVILASTELAEPFEVALAAGARAAENGSLPAPVDPILLDPRPWLDGSAELAEPDASAAALVSAFGPPHPRAAAYLLFTSGSTGRPKGVVISHAAAVNHMAWMAGVFEIGPGDRVLQKTPIGFDASVWEFWVPLTAGARLELAPVDAEKDPRMLVGELERTASSVLQVVPALLGALLDEPRFASGGRLRLLFCGGEPLGTALCDRFRERSTAELVNLYGPTEVTIDATFHRVRAASYAVGEGTAELRAGRGPTASLGRPIRNLRAHVLDPTLRWTLPGAVGELCLAGRGLGAGYHGQPARTAATFVPDPTAGPMAMDGFGARLYRTGDLVRRDPGGELAFIGRRDFQLKIRGHRIEPGEVEAALLAHPAVHEAVVVARAGGANDPRLVGYWVAGESGALVDEGALRTFLAERLPSYMMPAALVELERLPRTAHGKVDRGALPDPEWTAVTGPHVAPRTPTEALVAGIFASVLGVAEVGAEDDFFALGGHSLLGVRVISRLREAREVEIPIRRLFESPTVAGLATWLDLQASAATASEPSTASAVQPLPRTAAGLPVTPPPLSFAQERMWLLDRLSAGGTAYAVPTLLRLTGRLRPALLARALAGLVDRHETLRTRYAPGADDAPRQWVEPPPSWRRLLPVIDLSELVEGRGENARRRLADLGQRRPFDLARGPVFRAHLLREGRDRHTLALVIHHIATDGGSSAVLLADLTAAYRGLSAGRGVADRWEPLSLRYSDFAAWQRGRLVGEEMTRLLDHWREALRGAPALLDLPTDRPRTAVLSQRGGTVPFRLDSEVMAALTAFNRERGLTLFMSLLAAFGAVLGRYCGTEDLLLGSPIAGRDRRELEELVGLFVNSLVLRVQPRDGHSFEYLGAAVRATALAAYAHQELPFERLVDELVTERSLARPPLFQVALAVQETPATVLELPGVSGELVEPEGTTAKFELSLTAWRREDEIAGAIEYNRDLFDPSTVARMARAVERWLAAALTAPTRPIGELPWLGSAERHQLVHEWNGGGDRSLWSMRAPGETGGRCTVHGWVEEWARRTPEAPALIDGARTLSFRELDRAGDLLAARLRRLGAGRGAMVGILGQRGLELVAGQLGVLKSGAAYVSFDPSNPPRRLRALARDAGIQLLAVTSEEMAQLAAQARLTPGSAPPLRLDLELQGELEGGPEHEPKRESGGDEAPTASEVGPLDRAHVIYTSGSTGTPKGVSISHRGVERLMEDARALTLGPGERAGHLLNVSFDAATFEVWGALMAGAAVVTIPPEVALEPDRIAELWRRHGVTVQLLTTAIFNELAHRAPHAFDGLRTLLFGGEAADPDSVRRVLERAAGRAEGEPPLRLVNAYGPTESTTLATWHSIAALAADARAVPIGRSWIHTRTLVFDRRWRLAPLGAAGELWLGGDGLAHGYVGLPAKTAAAFVPDPFGDGERLYRTGDLVRWLPTGELDYAGRIDHQVKIRGFRIELGEIEAALSAHEAVSEAAVVLMPSASGAGEPWLAAFLARAAEAGEPATDSAWRLHLETRLPAYMVPAFFVELAELPKTERGKLDRSALRTLATDERARRAAALPADSWQAFGNPLEQRIAALLAEVLEVASVGPRDNFFDLGAHSMTLARLHPKLERELGRELPLVDLFRFPTVESLASHLGGGEATGAAPASRPRSAGAGAEAPREIAIIGMSGRFPGAGSVDELWRELCAGNDLVSFFSDDELMAAGFDEAKLSDPTWVPAGGRIRDFDRFDAGLFRVNPNEAAVLDPQQRVFLEQAWEALEDAACDPERFDGAIGLYAGVSMSQYWGHLLASGAVDELQMSLANDKDFVATRVSYKLNLKGPSVTVQTACSTSLVAVHMASRALAAGECDLALAGGVSIRAYAPAAYPYQPEGINSPDGHTRTFDAEARGTVPSNGAALVVLKRLADALADGDTIHAVIKGTAINNDGSDKVGFTAPSVNGQRDVITAALAHGGVDPASVSFVEAHGTATPVGDPIEVTALRLAYRPQGGAPLAIGSLKSNLGHMDAAAGAGSLIKAALALEHRRLPPSLHYQRPNPALGLEGSRIYVNTRLEPLERGPQPLRAGVSAFGLGGTNAHVVLEEPPPRPDSGPSGKWHLLTLSAASAAALDASAERLAAYLETSGRRQDEAPDSRVEDASLDDVSRADVSLADVAHTLAVGRRALAHRRTLVAESLAGAVRGLRGGNGSDLGGARDGSADGARGVILVLPGEVGAFEAEYELGRQWLAWGLAPEALAGQGAGELTAACLAGVFELDDALALLAGERRPEEVEARPPSIPLVCAESGERLGAEKAIAPAYWRRRLKAITQGSHDLATAFLVGAPDPRRILLVSGSVRQLERAQPSSGWTVVGSRPDVRETGEPPLDPRAGLLDAFGRLWAHGVAVDPAVLTRGEARRRLRLPTYPFERQRFWVEKPRISLEQLAGHTALEAQSGPAERSTDPGDWFYLPSWRPALPLPTLHLSTPSLRTPPLAHLADSAGEWLLLADAGGWAEAVSKRLRAAGRRCRTVYAGSSFQPGDGGRWEIDLQHADHYDRLLSGLAQDGATLRHFACFWPLDRSAAGEADAVLGFERAQDRGLYAVTFLAAAIARAGLPGPGATLTVLTRGAQAVGGGEQPAAFEATGAGGLAAITAEHPALRCRAVDLAADSSTDLDSAGAPLAARVDELAAELAAAERTTAEPSELGFDGVPRVALRHGRRWLPKLESVRVEAGQIEAGQVKAGSADQPLPRGAVCWLTSGLSPFALTLSEHLVARYGARVLLTHSAALPPEASWRGLLDEAAVADPAGRQTPETLLRAQAAQAIGRLIALRERGEVELVENTSVGDRRALAAALARGEGRFGPLQALFHLAGDGPVGFPQPLTDLTPTACDLVFAVKARGLEVLDALLAERELSMALIFATSGHAVAHPGKVAEGAATAFIEAKVEAIAAERARRGARPWTAVSWDGWPGATAQTGGDGHELTEREALAVVERAMTLCRRGAVARVVVSPVDPALRQAAAATAGTASSPRPVLMLAKRPNLPTPYHPPEGPLEERVAGCWQELLGIDGIGRFDPFLDLGGDSLLGLRLLARLREAVGVELTMADIFERPTIADLAELITERDEAPVDEAPPEPAQDGKEGTAGMLEAAGDDVASLEALLASVEALSEDEVESEIGKRGDESHD